MNDYFEQIKEDFGDWGQLKTIGDFNKEFKNKLSEHNFGKDNSRLVFSVCPDDLNRLQEIESIESFLTQKYNGEFHLGGLGSYPIGGITGITAASHHPPDNVKNGERKHGNLIFFISPHVGIIENNGFLYGKIIRPGQEKLTTSCGAMMGFLDQLKKAGDPSNFKIVPDENNMDTTRITLQKELINNYSQRLKEILSIENQNQQVISLVKLNYDVVMNKSKQMINEFLDKEKEHFKGNIIVFGGITINIPKKTLFMMKDVILPKK